MQVQTRCASGNIAWGRPAGAAFNLATASSPVTTSLCSLASTAPGDVACDFPVRHDPSDLQWL
jgi:hypothetical protein